MHLSEPIALLLVATAAALLPGISKFVRLSAVVMEILFGVVLGKSLLKLDFTGDWLEFLARLGFLLLMFQAGMEIDFSMLRKQSKGQLFFQLAVFGATLGLSVVAAFLLGQGVFLALVLSTTSLGLVMPTLKETKMLRTPLGQSIIIAATLADFLTLFGITFYVLFHEHGVGWRFLSPLPLFAGFGILLKIGRQWAWWNPDKAARLLSSDDSQELGVRLSFALLFLFVALSEMVHIEPVLGAFLGGAMLSVIFREKDNLETKLSGIGFGFLIPIFFINVGMKFDLTNVASPSQIPLHPETAGLRRAGETSAQPALRFQPGPVQKGVQHGRPFVLAPEPDHRGGLHRTGFGVHHGEFKDAIVLLAIMTCLTGPTIFKLLCRSEDDDKPGKAGKSGKGTVKNRITAGWMRKKGRP